MGFESGLPIHLTRQKARELPSFIEAPEFDPGQGFRLDDSFRTPIYRDGGPVRSFVPGWHPDGISLLFYPTIILQFRHVDGRSACWLLDATFTYAGSAIGEIPPRAQSDIRRRAASIMTFLDGLGEGWLPYRVPDDVASFLKLAAGTRQEMLRFLEHAQPESHQYGLSLADETHGMSFVSEVGVDLEGRRHFARPDRSCELLSGGEPVVLQPGWRILRMSSLFFPVFIADLQHESGQTAYWIFDRQGNYVTDRQDMLPETARVILASCSAMILEDLWQDIVAHPGDRTRDQVQAFLALPALTRNAIFDFHHALPNSGHRTAGWNLEDVQSAIRTHTAETERGAMPLDRISIDRALMRNLQDQNVILVNDGTISWPSPVDGKDVPASGFALLLDNLFFAYRVQDLELGLTFYVIAFGWYFRTIALYLPEDDLLIARDAEDLTNALGYRASSYRLHFLKHAVQFGAAILAGAKKPAGEICHTFRGQPAIHIGHHIWQDLSGIHYFLAAVKPDRIPRFLVLEKHLKPEIYGLIDSIFPCLEGKVIRIDESFPAMIAKWYEEHTRLIKATGLSIPRSIGHAIISAYKALPACQELLARCLQIRRATDLMVLVGLRAGNRTIVDVERFAIQLITAICDAFPGAVIIIDGQNASPEAFYGSVGDNAAASDSFLRQELDVAKALSEHATSRGITLINNIGRPIVQSLLWCDAADFFVAPWGAALAKYRWVCNKPGLVLTGRWNLLNRKDLAIYYNTSTNEDPARIWFNNPASVEDVVDAAETDMQCVERGSFRIDTEAIQKQFVTLLKNRLKKPNFAR